MRHAVAGFKLGRDTEHRRAMFRNLAAALFQHGQITTTLPKAKAVQPFVEKLITLARRGSLHARRQALAELGDRYLVDVVNGDEDGADVERDRHGKVIEAPKLISKLFDEIGPRFADRPGGYTRIVQLSNYRIGDAGDLVVLQLVGEEEEGGPRVRGRYSRRRQKQDNRTAFAAKLRKGGGETEAKEQPAAEQAQPEAAAEPATEEPEASAEQDAEGGEQQDKS